MPMCWKHHGVSQLRGTPLARSVTKQPSGAVCWGDGTVGIQTGIGRCIGVGRSIGVSRCVYRCWQWLCHQLPLQRPSPALGRTYLNALAGIARFPPIIRQQRPRHELPWPPRDRDELLLAAARPQMGRAQLLPPRGPRADASPAMGLSGVAHPTAHRQSCSGRAGPHPVPRGGCKLPPPLPPFPSATAGTDKAQGSAPAPCVF